MPDPGVVRNSSVSELKKMLKELLGPFYKDTSTSLPASVVRAETVLSGRASSTDTRKTLARLRDLALKSNVKIVSDQKSRLQVIRVFQAEVEENRGSEDARNVFGGTSQNADSAVSKYFNDFAGFASTPSSSFSGSAGSGPAATGTSGVSPQSEAERLRGQGLGTSSPSGTSPGPTPTGPVGPGSPSAPIGGGPGGGGADVPFNPGAGADPAAVKEGKSWHNIPSDGEIWSIDGVKHVAYQYEGGPFVYYKVPDKQWLDSRFLAGLPEVREYSSADVNTRGAIPMGSANMLANLGDTWQQGFDVVIDREVQYSPWLADGEVVALLLASTLEGRQLDPLELEATEWFGSRNDGEVAYARFAALADKDDFDDYHDRKREETRQALTRAGIRSPDQSLIDYVAQRGALGEWDDAKMGRQIAALSNPFSSIEMDEGLVSLLDGTTLDTLAGATEEVRAEVQRWLGPQHSQGFSDEQYRAWAGAALDDPNAANDLRDFLQGQRKALYPEYEDANLTYEDISTVWDNYLTNAWGETASDNQSWGVLDRIIRANSSEEAGRISRQEGLRLGVQKVEQDAMSTLGSAFGGQVQRSQT